MISELITGGIAAFIISFVATVLVKHFALRKGVIDKPDKVRKIHSKPIARLGGLAIYIAFAVVVAVVLLTSQSLEGGKITAIHYIGMLVGGLVLMIGGAIDDRFDLPPRFSIISPLVAAVVVIGFGVEVDKLTNPFGGVIYLSAWQSDILVFVWLMAVMYTTKFLDGLDGLATSIGSIGAFMIMLLALTTAYFQPDVALLSAIAIGTMLGFLFWNFHPASIFLGEGGSTFVGYVLGTLAVISGGKLATALLVLGIPLLDAIWVVVRRMRFGGIKQVFKADRKHLHHRLLDMGLGQKQVVFIYVLIASVFGTSTLFLQSRQKLVALILLCVIMLIAAVVLVQKEGKKLGLDTVPGKE